VRALHPLCLTACPTDAFPAPHVLDARRCISYLTIEHKGSIDLALRPLGNWVYGCDICQDVCPFQRFASPTAEPTFQTADLDRVAPRLVDLLALDEDRTYWRWTRIAFRRNMIKVRLNGSNANDSSAMPV